MTKTEAENEINQLIASVRSNGAYPAESFVGRVLELLLATQRKEILEEVEREVIGEDELRKTKKIPHKSAKSGYYVKTADPQIYVRNKLRAEQRTKLAEMKEGK